MGRLRHLPFCGVLLILAFVSPGLWAAGTASGRVISVKPIDKSGLSELIHQRGGKFLFLNIWATWCPPCREEFPDLAELAAKYEKRPIEFVALSADAPEEIDSQVLPFLRTQNVNFPVLIGRSADPQELIELINPDWSGALPGSAVYDLGGRLQEFFKGRFDPGQVTHLLDSLLAIPLQE